MRTASVGLLVMMAGCLLFIPASLTGSFAPFLAALFVLAAGVTTVQVVANPLISLLGPPATAHSRLTFAQAFNSLGTTLFPWAGATLILGSIATIAPDASPAEVAAHHAQETRVIWETYLGLALALAAIAAMVWWRRNRLHGSGRARHLGVDVIQQFHCLEVDIVGFVGAAEGSSQNRRWRVGPNNVGTHWGQAR